MLRHHHVGRVRRTRTVKVHVRRANIRAARNLTATRRVAMPAHVLKATARIKRAARSQRMLLAIVLQEIVLTATVARSPAARAHRFASARKACLRMID